MEKATYDALVKEMIKGDKFAYSSLYELHFHYIFSIVNGRIAHHDQAKDITQEVFMILWEKRQGLVLQQTLLAYLCGIAHHKCTDWQRDNQKQEQRKLQYARIKDAFLLNDAMEKEEALLLFYRAIRYISAPRCREILILRFIEDKSAREISLELDIQLQVTRNQLSRGTAIIRNFLKKG